MNKPDLVGVVAKDIGVSKKAAEAAVDAVFNGIVGALKSGDKVKIVGFGIFEAKDRRGRTGHNPATGEEINISARKAPTFRAGKDFKDALN